MYVVMALAAGVFVIVTMIFNSRLAGKIGVFQGTLVNYIVGLFFSILIILINKDLFRLSEIPFDQIPFWAYLGGLAGVVVIASSNVVIPKIPTIYSTLLIFIGQIIVGLLLDYITAGTVPLGRVIGGVLVIIGLSYNMYIDKRVAAAGVDKA